MRLHFGTYSCGFIAALALTTASASAAPIVNGDFETAGLLAGWLWTGAVTQVGTVQDYPPPAPSRH